MILTLTLNPAIDKTVVIPNFSEGAVNRIESVRTDIGGKGINVSKCLLVLGNISTAVAVWAGETGKRGKDYLIHSGFNSYSIELDEGETRTNLKIIDTEKNVNTDINEPGPTLDRRTFEGLMNTIDSMIKEDDILVLSGSLPKGLDSTAYRDMILFFKEKGVKTILDADGESFVYGIEAIPYLVKPNIDELCRYTKKELKTEEEIISAARELVQKGIKEVVVSLGADGSLFVTADKVLKAEALKVPVQSTVGAGDSMVAALAHGLDCGVDEIKRLKLATAISAASVMLSGTQPPELETVKKLYKEVTIKNVGSI